MFCLYLLNRGNLFLRLRKRFIYEYYLSLDMAEEKKPLTVQDKFVQNMLQSSQEKKEVRVSNIYGNIDEDALSKTMESIKKGTYRR